MKATRYTIAIDFRYPLSMQQDECFLAAVKALADMVEDATMRGTQGNERLEFSVKIEDVDISHGEDIDDLRKEARGLFVAFKQDNPAALHHTVIDALDALLDAVVLASEDAGHGKACMDDILSMAKEEASRIGDGAHSIKPFLDGNGFLKWQI